MAILERGVLNTNTPNVRGVQWEHLRYVAICTFLAMLLLFPNPNAVSFREDPTAGQNGTLLVQLLWFGLLGFWINCLKEQWIDTIKQFDMSLILLLGWCAMTVPIAILPDVSLRRYIFTLVAMIIAIFCVAVPRRAEAILWIFIGAIIVETLAKYFMVFAYPQLGRHTAFGLEPQLAGLWRGQYAHKNAAGPICVIELFIIFAARRKIPIIYLIMLAVPQFVFLLMSGSKTPLYLLLIIIIISQYITRSKNFIMMSSPAFLAVIGINVVTIGSTISQNIHDAVQIVVGDATFTGRTNIWGFLMQYAIDNPITGSGFLSFWQIGFLSPSLVYGTAWASTATYGHQGYLDIVATIGFPGLFFVLMFLLIRPCIDLSKIRDRDNPMLEMYISFWLLGIFTNGTESVILARADHVWMFTVIGIAGIRRCLLDENNTFRAENYLGARHRRKVSWSEGDFDHISKCR